jgi:hypothetical protein
MIESWHLVSVQAWKSFRTVAYRMARGKANRLEFNTLQAWGTNAPLTKPSKC